MDAISTFRKHWCDGIGWTETNEQTEAIEHPEWSNSSKFQGFLLVPIKRSARLKQHTMERCDVEEAEDGDTWSIFNANTSKRFYTMSIFSKFSVFRMRQRISEAWHDTTFLFRAMQLNPKHGLSQKVDQDQQASGTAQSKTAISRQLSNQISSPGDSESFSDWDEPDDEWRSVITWSVFGLASATVVVLTIMQSLQQGSDPYWLFLLLAKLPILVGMLGLILKTQRTQRRVLVTSICLALATVGFASDFSRTQSGSEDEMPFTANSADALVNPDAMNGNGESESRSESFQSPESPEIFSEDMKRFEIDGFRDPFGRPTFTRPVPQDEFIPGV